MVTLFKTTRTNRHHTASKRYALNSIVATVGYILSPLSWWNDMVVNVPLAYALSIPFTLLSDQLFLPAFILGYWFTNVLGFILLHVGVVGLVRKQPRQHSLWQHIVISLVYTAIIILLVWLQWIPMPAELIQQFNGST